MVTKDEIEYEAKEMCNSLVKSREREAVGRPDRKGVLAAGWAGEELWRILDGFSLNGLSQNVSKLMI